MGEDNSHDEMTLDRLRVILDCYGAATDRWPADERRSAQALLETSAEARALRGSAAALDGALSLLQAPPTSERAMEHVRGMVSGPSPASAGKRLSWLAALLPASLPQAAAFAGVALIAFLAGASLPDLGAPAPTTAGNGAAVATAEAGTAEDPNGGTIGDVAIVDAPADVGENGTIELAAAESVTTTESVDSLTDIPLQ